MSLHTGERVKGDRCGFENCPSRWYTIDQDGYYYCQQGHRLAAPLATGEDEDDFGTEGRTTKKRKEEREKVRQQLQGRKGFALYLESYQLILWKQAHWLIHSKGFPKDLESIIRDLWALRLQSFTLRVDDDLESESQSQLFSSQEDITTDTGADNPRKRRQKLDSAPRLIDTLALCYLGMIVLRLPVSVGDVHRWATSGEMLYFGAIKQIPIPMRDRLPSEYHESLEPTIVLKPDALHTAVVELAMVYDREFEVQFPNINHPPLLLHYVKELALPPDVYPAAEQLARLVSYSFGFPGNATAKRLRIIDFPEPQLIAVLVVATKLLWPFDGMVRNPASVTEPAAAVVDWEAWAQAKFDYKAVFGFPDRLKAEEAMNVTEDDVFSMSDQQLDDYLDWYESNWTDTRANEKASDFYKALFEMFPISRPGTDQPMVPQPNATAADAAKIARIKAVQQSVVLREVIPQGEEAENETEVARPGNLNRLYRTQEELTGHAKAFFEEAAMLTGLSLPSLIKAVFLTEIKLKNWKEKKKRADVEGGF